MSKATFERRRFLQLTLLGSIAFAIAGCAHGGGYRPPRRLRSPGSQHGDKDHGRRGDHGRKGLGGGAGGGHL